MGRMWKRGPGSHGVGGTGTAPSGSGPAQVRGPGGRGPGVLDAAGYAGRHIFLLPVSWEGAFWLLAGPYMGWRTEEDQTACLTCSLPFAPRTWAQCLLDT